MANLIRAKADNIYLDNNRVFVGLAPATFPGSDILPLNTSYNNDPFNFTITMADQSEYNVAGTFSVQDPGGSMAGVISLTGAVTVVSPTTYLNESFTLDFRQMFQTSATYPGLSGIEFLNGFDNSTGISRLTAATSATAVLDDEAALPAMGPFGNGYFDTGSIPYSMTNPRPDYGNLVVAEEYMTFTIGGDSLYGATDVFNSVISINEAAASVTPEPGSGWLALAGCGLVFGSIVTRRLRHFIGSRNTPGT